MKKIFLFLGLIATSFICMAQNSTDDEDKNKVYNVVDEMPEFPGGVDALLKYVARTIVYPDKAREKGIEGKVYITFTVDTAGKVKDANLIRGIGGGCDEEALRVVNSIPKWKPGKQNGRLVNVLFTLPINFHLGTKKEVKEFKEKTKE